MNTETTEGLNPQDEQRAQSMADEGGAAGAVVEAQEPSSRARGPHWGWMATGVACGGLVAYWLKRR
jgi:hypothetical protein